MREAFPKPIDEMDEPVLALQVEHAFHQLKTSLLVNAANGLILIMVLWGQLGARRLIGWLLALYLVTLLRYLLLKAYRRADKVSPLDHKRWATRFLLGAMGSGLAWGAAGTVLFHPTSIPHQIFLAFALGGMIAGALPLLSTVAHAFPAFAAPVAIPVILELGLHGGRIQMTMVALFVIFILAMLVSSRQFGRLFRESIELRLKLSSSIEEKRQEALLARRDTLTGIANRRHFDETLASEWKRAQRTGEILSLVIADIDYFKLYNDRLGHLAGDLCLRQVAKSMATAARRPGDMVARIGGEEFAFLLPSTPLEDAEAIAERIREDIQALEIAHPASPIAASVTISLGVAEGAPGAGMTIEALIGAADAALYRAKGDGRNRVARAATSRSAVPRR